MNANINQKTEEFKLFINKKGIFLDAFSFTESKIL